MNPDPQAFDDEDRTELVRSVLEQLVKGEDRQNLLNHLLEHLDQQSAESTIDDASAPYDELRNNGKLEDFEYDMYFSDNSPKNKETRKGDKFGIGLILIGFIGSAVSYTNALPGQTYTLYAGLIVVGAIILFTGK